MTLEKIYLQALPLINSFIQKEMIEKGHHLTGAMEESLDATVSGGLMEGFAIAYTQYVNDGTRPEKASMKQWWYVKNYFLDRGLSDKEAGGAAAATIKVWMKEGMSTKASERFSKDGTRNKVIEDAFTNHNEEIDAVMFRGFDKGLEEQYRKEKSETI